MLEELSIENFALIERLHLPFRSGFTVFTGETGAGKSILAGALGLLAGARGSLDQVRSGAEEAHVSGVFSVPNNPGLRQWLDDRGIAIEDGSLIIRRVLRQQGKNGAYIQNTPVTIKDISEISEFLFDMHGQHEHQALFDTRFHRRYLDAYSGLLDLGEKLKNTFLTLNSAKKKLETLSQNQADRDRERQLLQFAIDEIDAAQISPHEDRELEQEKAVLDSAEELMQLSQLSYELLHGEEGGILPFMYRLKDTLGQIDRLDSSQRELSERVTNTYYELEDISDQVLHYKDRVSIDPERLELINERLDVLYKLKKKYGGTLSHVLSYRQEAEEKLTQLLEVSGNREQIQVQIQQLESDVLNQAVQLTKLRRMGAQKMEKQVATALEGLRMGKTGFAIQVTQRKSESGTPLCGPYGADEIEFLLSPNPGEPLKPLRSIASGGEISRVMLAVKSVLSEVEGIDTLVFDEIDTGIGGEVGLALGTYMHKTAEKRQLFSITHLASIAVQADNHIMIQKKEDGGRTFTHASYIEGNQRVTEIARMLSGTSNQKTSLNHALELLVQFHPEQKYLSQDTQGSF